jgi:hypothetical protein
MRVIRAAAVIVLLAGPAFAQEERMPKYGEAPKDKSAVEIESERAADRAYKHSLGNIPDKGPGDPWGNLRSDGPPKAVAKAAAPKQTKTGGTAN